MFNRPAVLLLVTLCSLQAFTVIMAAPLIDPTRPYDYVAATTKTDEPVVLPREQIQWDLSVIKIGSTSRFAIINGQLVRPGESVDSARLIEIRPAAVVLEYDKQTIIVTLLDRAVKKTTR